jgi:hypothetical protein
MGEVVYLAPVGHFVGLSEGGRREIAAGFPALSLSDIEGAARQFSETLAAPKTGPNLSEARDLLCTFNTELRRFRKALVGLRKHRIVEACRSISGEDAFLELDRSLAALSAATSQTSRALPFDAGQVASRTLVGALALHLEETGLARSAGARATLVSLVYLILDDLMAGGDAAEAVSDWERHEGAVASAVLEACS